MGPFKGPCKGPYVTSEKKSSGECYRKVRDFFSGTAGRRDWEGIAERRGSTFFFGLDGMGLRVGKNLPRYNESGLLFASLIL